MLNDDEQYYMEREFTGDFGHVYDEIDEDDPDYDEYPGLDDQHDY